jgi:hypothetical protein
MRLMSRRLTFGAFMVGIAFLLGVLTACGDGRGSVTTSESDQSAHTELLAGPGSELLARPGTPCLGAVHGDPMKLAAISRVPVYLPSDRAAQVTEAWRCGSMPFFMFDDVQLALEPGWRNVKIPEKLEALARDAGGSVETIQGLPAWVAPSSASASNDEVLIVKDGAAIKLLALGGVPIGDLVALAKSLDLDAPLGA